MISKSWTYSYCWQWLAVLDMNRQEICPKLNIVVCMKQVPDTKKVQLNTGTNTLDRNNINKMMNPADASALEQAYRLKKANGGEASVRALTMGPRSAEDVLKQAAHQGADRLILLTDSAYVGSDTYATAKILSRAILATGPFDLILCGRKTIDGETGQVGPQLSVQLGVPCLTNVTGIELNLPGILCKRLTEKGIDEIYVPLPAVVTLCENMPEHKPALAELRKAREINIEQISNRHLELEEQESGLKGSKTRVVRILHHTYQSRNCRMADSMEEAADLVMNKISENRKNE